MMLHASADSGAAAGAQLSACGATAAGVTGAGVTGAGVTGAGVTGSGETAACVGTPLRGRITVGSSGREAAGGGALVAGTRTRLGVMVFFPSADG